MAYKVTNNIVMENARLIFKNFSGEESKFNRKGNRNFCVVLDPEVADDLIKDGWNVRFLRPRRTNSIFTSICYVWKLPS